MGWFSRAFSRIGELYRWLIHRIRRPRRVRRFRGTVDMSNVRLTWDLPAVGPTQRQIDYVRIDFRVDATLPWTEQDRVTPDVAQELLFQDVAPGLYFYQATVVDVDGVEGPPVETSVDVAFDGPGSVANFTATVE